MNHAAVRSVSMRSLNRQRASIVLSNLMQDDKVLTPQHVSQHERIFEWDGVLRWKGASVIGKAHIGVNVQQLLSAFAPAHSTTGAMRDADLYLQRMIELYKKDDFLFWCDRPQGMGYIVLKESATPETQLKAWAVALWVVHRLQTHPHATSAINETNESVFNVAETTLHELTNRWESWMKQMKTAGWDTQVASLETVSGTRIHLAVKDGEDKSPSRVA